MINQLVMPEEIYDTKSLSYFSLNDGQVIVRQTDGISHKWPIPQSHFHPLTRNYLKFALPSRAYASINSTGTLLLCKSDLFQQVDMNCCVSEGMLFWELLVPHSVLGFTVGVKDCRNKHQQAFDFSLKLSTRLVFKLNLEDLTFKCWINGAYSEFKKPIQLPKNHEWTPFVRLKDVGTAIVLNPFIRDPEAIVSPFNIFCNVQNSIQKISQQVIHQANLDLTYNRNFSRIASISRDNLILIGSQHLKFLRREPQQKHFDFAWAHYSEHTLTVLFTEKEYQLLTEAENCLQVRLIDELYRCYNGGFYMAKRKDKWREWGINVCSLLDKALINLQAFPTAIIKQAYEIIISKFQQIRPALNQLQLGNCLLDSELISTVRSISGSSQQSQTLTLPSRLAYNNCPVLEFNSKIISWKATSKFFVVRLEGDRVCVINYESLPFNVGSFWLSKSLKKKIELNEYKKQVDELTNNNFSQPSIYRILKNCLKYADKIKPPEKVIKELESKKAKIEQKKNLVEVSNGIQPDKQLQRTLISMEFMPKIVEKVLVQCKNASLEAALELLLNKYNKETYKESEQIVIPTADWTCSQCTLLNVKTALVCAVCEALPPQLQELVAPKPIEENLLQSQAKIGEEEQIASQNIDQQIIDIYVWETDIGYCPLLIVIVYNERIRLRLFGPNPKYYSNFYSKDQGYLDLWSMRSKESADQIYQKPINTLNNIYSTSTELKLQYYNWIPIQDCDIPLGSKNIHDIQFTAKVHKKDTRTFSVDILTLNNDQIEFISLPCLIKIANVYQANKRCLHISQSEVIKVNPANAIINKLYNFQQNAQKYKLISVAVENNVEEHCYQTNLLSTACTCASLSLTFSKKSKQQNNQRPLCRTIPLPKQKTASTSKQFLPLFVLQAPYNSQTLYPHCSLQTPHPQPTDNPFLQSLHNSLVLAHLQSRPMLIQSVILQRTKNGSNYPDAGYIYLSNNLQLMPLVKYAFSFSEQCKKISILVQKCTANYLVVVLNQDKIGHNLELNYVAAYGQTVPSKLIPVAKTRCFKSDKLASLVHLSLKSSKGPINIPWKIQANLINPRYDFSLLSTEQLSQSIDHLLTNNHPIDCQALITIDDLSSVQNQQIDTISIDSSTMQGFLLVNTIWNQHHKTNNQKQNHRAQFQQLLDNYFHTYQVNLLQLVVDELYEKYRQEILKQNMYAYFVDYVSRLPYSYNLKNALLVFIKTFSAFIVKQVNIDAIFNQCLKSGKMTAYGLELLLQLSQITQPISTSLLISTLTDSFSKILTAKKEKLALPSYDIYAQKSIFSPYYYQQQSRYNNLFNQSSNRIPLRFMMQKTKFLRKYTIDMLSVYNVNQINLNFQKSRNSNRMCILLYSYTFTGEQVLQGEYTFSNSVWNQLTRPELQKSKHRKNNSSESNTNALSQLRLPVTHSFKTRYLLLQISFTLLPFTGSKVQIQHIPQNQILPQICGHYVGQCQPVLNNSSLLVNNNLSFVKRVKNFSKYSTKNSTSVSVYDQEQNISDGNQLTLKKIAAKTNLPEYRKLFVNKLMKHASTNNLNYHYTICYVFINELVERNQLKGIQFDQLLWEMMINLVNEERGIIQEKLISLMRKQIIQNPLIAVKLCEYKFNSQTAFSKLFKETHLLTTTNGHTQFSELITTLQTIWSQSRFMNIFWLLKLLDTCPLNESINHLLEQFLALCVNRNRFDEAIELLVKYGWIKGTVSVIEKLLIDPNQTTLVENIIHATKNPQQLVEYALTCTQANTDKHMAVLWTIFEQLKIRKNKPTASSLAPILQRLLKLVQTLSSQFDDDSQGNQFYTRIIKIINVFGSDSDTATLLITTFFTLSDKRTLLPSFTSCKLFQSPFYYPTILNQILHLLNNHLQSSQQSRRLHSSHNTQDLFLINDLLGLIMQQIANPEKDQLPFTFTEQLQTQLTTLFVKYISILMNMTGIEYTKIIDRKLSTKISIGYYLSLLVDKHQTIISPKNLSKLIHWYFFNVNPQLKASSYWSVAINNFLTIEYNVWNFLWNIIVNQTKTNNHIFNVIFIEVFEQILKDMAHISNPAIRSLIEKKIYYVVLKLFRNCQPNSLVKPIIVDLLSKQKLLLRLLKQLQTIQVFQDEENSPIEEKQLVNKLILIGEIQQKPKDWLIHKNGAKNNVYTLDYGKTGVTKLLFKSQKPITLTKLLIAFECSSNKQKNVCVPSDIILQTGRSLDSLCVVANLFTVPDDYYMNFSVKIFGANCLTLNYNNLAYNSRRNQAVTYLQLTIKSPATVSICDALNTQQSLPKDHSSLINFLSIQGICPQGKTPNEAANLVSIIEQIIKPQYKQTLEQQFTKNQTILTYQSSLLSISRLMSQQKYQRPLYNFLMKICEINADIGNKMLSEYLQINNSVLTSKISADIVLSNRIHQPQRVAQFFAFITSKLAQLPQLVSLYPFLNRFSQIVFIVQRRDMIAKSSKIYNPIELFIPSEEFSKLCLRESKNQIQLKFVRAILSVNEEFLLKGIDINSLYQSLYKSKTPNNYSLLASLVADCKKARQWFMEHNYLQAICQTICQMLESSKLSGTDIAKQKISQININLKFLQILAGNRIVKSIINKHQYNLRILEVIVDKKYDHLFRQNENAELRNNIVGFVSKSSLGTQNQMNIGGLLKDSLVSMVLEGNKKFVNEVFLPLLNSYSKTAVCIIPYNFEQTRIITDISTAKNTQQFRPKQPKQKVQAKFRLPTAILTEEDKNKLFGKIKYLTRFKSGFFNLITNHGSTLQRNNIEQLCKAFSQGKSILILLRIKNRQRQFVLRIFYSSNKPRLGSTVLHFSQGSFVSIFEKDKQPFYITSSSESDSFISIQLLPSNEDFAEEKHETLIIRCRRKNIVELPLGDFLCGTFCLDLLPGENVVSNELVLHQAEYWALDCSTESKNQSQQTQPQHQTLSFTKNLINQFTNVSYFRKDFLAEPSLQMTRYQHVYQFPSSITLDQLKSIIQVLNCGVAQDKLASIKFTVLGVTDSVKSNWTLQHLATKLIREDVVIDIVINFDKMVENLDFTVNNPTREQFLPTKGILKCFEEKDGVSSMIKVIRKSIQSWSNISRRQKWTQYVIELEKFNCFSHFFSMYLKDNEAFTLLFNLLSGLPDKQTDKKWDDLEAKSSLELLKIVVEILRVDKSKQFREEAIKNDFLGSILERLRMLTGIFKRKYEKEVKPQIEASPSKQTEQDDSKKQIKKKKGVGYGANIQSDTKWMKGQHLVGEKKQFEVIDIILNVVENFLDAKNWTIPPSLLQCMNESALLPYVEDCLRAGTLLQISKHPVKFRAILRLIRVFSKHKQLIICLLPLPANYQPKQTESLQSLLKQLDNTSKIFKSCLSQSKSKEDKLQEQLANDIIETYQLVQQAIEDYREGHDQLQGEQAIKKILEQPLPRKYRAFLRDLRFDYIDMKQNPNKIKHHYSSSFTANYTPSQNKMIRLAQQLADISIALPYEHTNGIYVRCDKDRVDFMQAMIMGSNSTPYGHGAYLFDIYFDENYPAGPPKVNLTTTGHGKVRFNPNLYACGKVCLSLLGTWRGSASENWDSKVSTLLQVLLSIQAIIMSEDVYFNEPGFQNQQGTEQGDKKNEAYSNIVRYSNIKFAMIDNIKNPPKGFQAVIRRHFYLKKDQITEECRKWVKYAEKRPAKYIGLVNDHNVSWSTEFKKAPKQYKEMLETAIKELEEELAKIPAPQLSDIAQKVTQKKEKKKAVAKDLLKQKQNVKKQDIDVGYDTQTKRQGQEIDINDEKVKDRWSRYIGAMGIDAVSKQSKADILVFGLGPMSLQTVKNLVLSGCRKLTICDSSLVTLEDLSGGFFYQQQDLGKKRVQSILYKVRELNIYVKVDTVDESAITVNLIKTYTIVLVTEATLEKQLRINEYCRSAGVKFILADCNSAYCRLINDFGDNFQVLDKNGQQPTQVIIKDISCTQKGIVTLLDGVKHPYEDGQAVVLGQVEGMTHLEDNSKSINGTIHKIRVINSKSFQIGNTLAYSKYVRNGTAKNIKTPTYIKYLSLPKLLESCNTKMPFDENLQTYDFVKMDPSKLIHFAYLTIDAFKKQHNRIPEAWCFKDADLFMALFKIVYKDQIDQKQQQYLRVFCMTYQGYLPPLCAFFGGFVAQEIIKGITQKFKPVNSMFCASFAEVIAPLPESIKDWKQQQMKAFCKDTDKRNQGFCTVVGKQLIDIIKDAKLFMIGAGAIGCQLLKNFAMIGLGTGETGKITLTDPDHIQNSNLNRQFLFRQKHISKPKSLTAAASILLMNPNLKDHISALQQRVSDATKDIFDNKFFESRTIIANALDNVAARRYVDQRCVQNKVPLFESGTLGPKGHTQVIIPYLTESYGSQNDPVEQGQIPHCTLKMFPQQILHCVEWARDIFGRKFTLQPKALLKLQDKQYKPEKDDIKTLNESLTMLKKAPKNFDDCIRYAVTKFYRYFRDDIMQLLYTYPLDAKTKNGQPFWKLPKRPPTPIHEFDPSDLLHCTFVTVMAVLLAKIYCIPYPNNFRTDKSRFEFGKEAVGIKIAPFVPSDQKAKAILKQATEEKKAKDEKQGVNIEAAETDTIAQEQPQPQIQDQDEHKLYSQLLTSGLLDKQFQIKAEQFEKDVDANGHIDFIYAMANLRAINYKLDRLDWITTKIKAGRIVPALATTTSCVAGLQTLQICKYLKKVKIDHMRNAYLNLAVPSLQMSEPGQVSKKKITDKLIVTLWDRWEVQCTDKTTFGDLYTMLRDKYELVPVGILQGMSRIDTAKTQQDKSDFLACKLLDKLQKEDDSIDLIVLFAKADDQSKILEGLPPIRLRFK